MHHKHYTGAAGSVKSYLSSKLTCDTFQTPLRRPADATGAGRHQNCGTPASYREIQPQLAMDKHQLRKVYAHCPGPPRITTSTLISRTAQLDIDELQLAGQVDIRRANILFAQHTVHGRARAGSVHLNCRSLLLQFATTHGST